MKRFSIVAMVLCSFSFIFAQGMYWKSTQEGMGGTHEEESYAMPKMFKIVRTGGNSAMIFRLDKELMWNVNMDDKTYSEMTFADMEKMMKKASARMDAMKEQMKEMPEERRKMMEKMMGGSDQPVDVKKTGETKTISGYKCVQYNVLRGGEEFMTLWIADDVKEFKPLMNDWKSFSQRMSEMAARFANGMADVYKKVSGFPMETTVNMMGQTFTTTVTKIEKRTLSASDFEVPAGFKKVKSPMEEQMGGMGGGE